ncbi:MAG: hypothetical protein AAFQ81_06315 [Pseudomonadota bacterium]
MRFLASVAVVVLALATLPATGAVLYDSGVTFASASGASGADAANSTEQANRVPVPAGSLLTGVSFIGRYFPTSAVPPASDAFTLRLYADAPGSGPQNDPFAEVALTTTRLIEPMPPAGGGAFYSYEASFAGILLEDPAVWVSIQNDTAPGQDNLWGWASGSGATSLLRTTRRRGAGAPAPWGDVGTGFQALTLEGAPPPVPLPASGLLLAGLIAFGLRAGVSGGRWRGCGPAAPRA